MQVMHIKVFTHWRIGSKGRREIFSNQNVIVYFKVSVLKDTTFAKQNVASASSLKLEVVLAVCLLAWSKGRAAERKHNLFNAIS